MIHVLLSYFIVASIYFICCSCYKAKTSSVKLLEINLGEDNFVGAELVLNSAVLKYNWKISGSSGNISTKVQIIIELNTYNNIYCMSLSTVIVVIGKIEHTALHSVTVIIISSHLAQEIMHYVLFGQC